MAHKHPHKDPHCPTHAHHHDACESHGDACASDKSHGDSCCSSPHHHHHHEEDSFSRQLLELADEAWMEVLKEKIKDQIREHNGANLEKLAQIVAETNNHRWKNKLDQKHSCNAFKDKLHEFFNT